MLCILFLNTLSHFCVPHFSALRTSLTQPLTEFTSTLSWWLCSHTELFLSLNTSFVFPAGTSTWTSSPTQLSTPPRSERSGRTPPRSSWASGCCSRSWWSGSLPASSCAWLWRKTSCCGARRSRPRSKRTPTRRRKWRSSAWSDSVPPRILPEKEREASASWFNRRVPWKLSDELKWLYRIPRYLALWM